MGFTYIFVNVYAFVLNMLPIVQLTQLSPPHLKALAQLRIDVFKEYPYLYQGSYAYEEAYLSKFLRTPKAYIIAIFDEGRLVGSLTGLPLVAEEAPFQAPWLTEYGAIHRLYYISEVLLYPDYRGQGLGKALFRQAEAAIEAKHCFEGITFATVIRPPQHPLKPATFRSSDPFWRDLGYQPQADKIGFIPWQDLNETSESLKSMQFWYKALI